MFLKWFARTTLRLGRWQFEGELPTLDKYVCLAAPHTSWWDGPMQLLFGKSQGMDYSWMVKHTVMRPPFGWLIRSLGGVPIDRRARHGVVQQMTEQFEQRERFILLIPPEGTRRRAEHWRSGFYHIARAAKVPVVPTFLDFAGRRAGVGVPIHLTGDVRGDMDQIRAFYAASRCQGKFPERFGPIRLVEEEPAIEAVAPLVSAAPSHPTPVPLVALAPPPD